MAFLLIASFAAVASAKSFLDVRVGASSIERALLSEISGLADAALFSSIEDDLRSMCDALPKNQHGRLDPVPVRYALHRYFMQKHGWYVNGLGAANSTEDTSTSASIMKDRAPSFIQQIFERRLHGQGLTCHDLAVFAATMTDLIHNEVSGNLQQVYAALEYPTVGLVTEKEFDTATKAYLLAYLSGGREVVSNMEEMPTVERSWEEDFPTWNDTLMWASDLKLAVDVSSQYHLNPFVQRRHRSFEEQVSFLQEFGHRLGTFQNLECRRLKNLLADMEDVGTGRVPLSRFYRGGLEGDWTFTESVEYLRNIGALDETNPQRMSVVIPNYIHSQSNCLAGSSFYSICCFDECEDLLGHVEQKVKGPSAPPAQIADVVSNLHSDTVYAPRNLSQVLLSRLEDIARFHEGSVQLHGRLFAQWMHHVYPRECPFPHVIGATTRISPSEWMDEKDLDSAEATDHEMASFVRFKKADDPMTSEEAMLEALPWTMEEELVAGQLSKPESTPPSRSWKAIRLVALVLLLAALATPITHLAQYAFAGQFQSKPIRFAV